MPRTILSPSPISKSDNQPVRSILKLNDSAVGGIALTLAYGFPIRPRDDPYIKLVGDSVHEIIKAGFPGTYLVDSIPILKHVPAWIPGAGFQNVAERSRTLNQRLKDEPFEAAMQHMVRSKPITYLPILTSSN